MWSKSNIKHTISFIEYDHFDLFKCDCFLFNVVYQTSRGCNDNMWFTTQIINLMIHRSASNNNCGLKSKGMSNFSECFLYLNSQLTSWYQYQTLCFEFCQSLKHRNSKSKCLPCSGLSNTHHIFSFECNRNRLQLDWSRVSIVVLRQNL